MEPGSKRSRRRGGEQNIDRHVGGRVRERRIMLGLSQGQFGELIGVSYQQAHRYEQGLNRMGAGRLYRVAQVLGVDVGYFFDGIGRDETFRRTQEQRLLLELARYFMAIPISRYQEEVVSLVRALAEPDARR